MYVDDEVRDPAHDQPARDLLDLLRAANAVKSIPATSDCCEIQRPVVSSKIASV